ncbi:MAG: bifunctional UDP-N-acetylglucosamine diphosphorylase/glucosamine-1-phosphate N-acetyltransferase GlmU [Tissierellia bacterium]|nr:bifunctional UDP-N-acetylglucosamine diphosphorylase/glucosamine-1-phosphate N-acetyltransferase GlmU [Tissierellia bacterium]
MNIAVVLAAGEGTRMKSKYPKVLKKALGKCLVEHAIDAARKAGVEKQIVIVGNGGDLVREHVKSFDVVFKDQPIGEGQPYGTGFAVMQAVDEIKDGDKVLILYGDVPLIKSNTIEALFAELKNYEAVVLTSLVTNPYGYGRIIKNKDGDAIKIIEENDANEKEKKIQEINSGIMVFKGRALKNALKEVTNDNIKKEYYLTDTIEILTNQRKRVGALVTEDFEETLGVNSNSQLSYITDILRRRIIEAHMAEGVEIVNPDNTYIETDVVIGRDTIIYPGVTIEKGSTIGEDVVLRGDTRIHNSQVGDRSQIESSLIEDSFIGEDVKVGPFAHVRPNSNIKNKAKLGNFVEVKNSNIGEGTKIPHLTYVGDADVGKSVNFGCGSVVVNYDGIKKTRSSIGDDSFIGCNANLVSPVRLDGNCFIAAGSTITKDVEEYQLAIERGEQRNIDGWVKNRK